MQNFQKILKDRGYYSGAIDGIVGPLTLGGAKQWIDAEMNIRGWVKPVNDFVWIRTGQTFDNRFSDYVVRFQNRIADMVMPCTTSEIAYSRQGFPLCSTQKMSRMRRFVTMCIFAGCISCIS